MHILKVYAYWQLAVFAAFYMALLVIPDRYMPLKWRKKLNSFRSSLTDFAMTAKDIRMDRPQTWLNPVTKLYVFLFPEKDPFLEALELIPGLKDSLVLGEVETGLVKSVCGSMISSKVHTQTRKDGLAMHEFHFKWKNAKLFVKSKQNDPGLLNDIISGNGLSFYYDGIDPSDPLYVKTTVKELHLCLKELCWGSETTLIVADGGDNSKTLAFRPYDLSPFQYSGHLLDEVPRWMAAIDRGIKRRVLLQGRPGTGKTTFCYHVAKTYFKKTMILTPEIYRSCKAEALIATFQLYDPDIIIINDIDYLSEAEFNAKLDVFEQYCPSLVFYTSNHLEKIPTRNRRPGRVDETIIVDPSDDEILTVLNHFAKKMGLDAIPENQQDIALKIMKTLGPSHAQEFIIRLSLVGMDYKISPKDLTFSLEAYQKGTYNTNTKTSND